jgi:acyl carrier protein
MSGIHDLKSISPNSTLTELGLDSMTVVEIQQSLVREFGLILTLQEIRSLTFARILEMAANNQDNEAEEQPSQGKKQLRLNGNDLWFIR